MIESFKYFAFKNKSIVKMKGIAFLLLAVISAVSLAIYLSICRQLASVVKSVGKLVSFACLRDFSYLGILWGLASIVVLISSLGYFIILNAKSGKGS